MMRVGLGKDFVVGNQVGVSRPARVFRPYIVLFFCVSAKLKAMIQMYVRQAVTAPVPFYVQSIPT